MLIEVILLFFDRGCRNGRRDLCDARDEDYRRGNGFPPANAAARSNPRHAGWLDVDRLRDDGARLFCAVGHAVASRTSAW